MSATAAPSPVSVLDAIAEPITTELTIRAERHMRMQGLNDRLQDCKAQYAKVLGEVASIKQAYDAEMAPAAP